MGSSIKLEGYTFFSKVRENKAGGGVGIFIDNEVKQNIAPHTSPRNLEIIWISVKRKNSRPLFIGVYYGKQESEGSKEDIGNEFGKLTEEIMEVQQEGELILFMDANAKIGLMGEQISRNGKLLLQTIEETETKLVNGTGKCSGTITRQNRRKIQEKSAIDFVVADHNVMDWIMEMEIDESGLYRPKGKNETDHNAILVRMHLEMEKQKRKNKVVVWNLRADEEKWKKFRHNLQMQKTNLENIMTSPDDMDSRYKKWEGTIVHAAKQSIGKTTLKENGKEKFSENVERLRAERRKMKNLVKNTDDASTKYQITSECIKIQEKIRQEIKKEKRGKIEKRLEEVKDKNIFWKERKAIRKDHTQEWCLTKDSDGNRVYGEEQTKNNLANYYESLYKEQNVAHHTYHDEVLESIESYENNMEYEEELYNSTPTIEEVAAAIARKKGGKATTDFKNEMIKKGDKQMAQAIMPVIEAVWREENIPSKWNEGIITSLWKGKGDREDPKNHRGITVSSAIGTIPEMIINDRYTRHMKFTQAQAGGRGNYSTCDHVFVIRAITEYSLKMKKKIFVTFYDVSKAFDHAEVNDMFYAAWKSGIKGKIWRLGKRFQEKLTARVKTRYGDSRCIKRQCGGKQGGHIMPTIFGKMMDTLADELLEEQMIGARIEGMLIPALLFVDDATTITEGEQDQVKMLEKMAEFAKKHKMEWGIDKCKVMQIGRGKNLKPQWKLGDKDIDSTADYKYLGDYVSRNGTNRKNLEERAKKVNQAMRAIKSCAREELMEKIQNQVILTLHEVVTIPTLLTNAESWNLTVSDEKECEKIEARALKEVFGLPSTFPTPALVYATGTLFTKIRMDKKRFMFLHKILTREENHWTRHMLEVLDKLGIGWSKNIRIKLETYGLEQDWDKIRKMTKNEWKRLVTRAVEKRNKERLIEECHQENGEPKEKTKHMLEELNREKFARSPSSAFKSMNRNQMRIILIARYGMLDCGKNYHHKYGSKLCRTCSQMDDENHRINGCERQPGNKDWVEFRDIFQDKKDTLLRMAEIIAKVWGVERWK